MARYAGGHIQDTAIYLQPDLTMPKTLPATLLAPSPLQQTVCSPVMMTQIYLVAVSVSFALIQITLCIGFKFKLKEKGENSIIY